MANNGSKNYREMFTYKVIGIQLQVSGWGLMEEKGEEQPEVLQKVDVPYFTPGTTCQRVT